MENIITHSAILFSVLYHILLFTFASELVFMLFPLFYINTKLIFISKNFLVWTMTNKVSSPNCPFNIKRLPTSF